MSNNQLSVDHGPTYRISPNSTLERTRREPSIHLTEADKSKSFDNNNYGLSYNYEFDKSKSFDENYGTADDSKRIYMTPEIRSFSHDRVYGSSSSNEYSSASRNRSPHAYANRLYEPEMPYNDISRNRSPLLGYGHRRTLSRERSPIPGGRYQKPNDLYLMRTQTPDSDFDGSLTPDFDNRHDSNLFKEADLVKKFLYANKNKQIQRDSRNIVPPAGTPTSGRY